MGAFESHLISQTITFPLPPLQEDYGSSFTVDPTTDSGLAVTVTASGACKATVVSGGYKITMTSGVGTCTLTASQGGDLVYLPADDAVQTVRAAPQPLTVTADDKSSTYGGTAPSFTVSFSGFVGTDNAGSLGGALTFKFSGTNYVSSSTPPTAVGTYTIMPDGYSSTNYSIDYGAGTYAIGKGGQAIDVTTPAPNSAPFDSSFTVAATGGASGNPVTYSSAGVCSNSGAVFTMTSATGTCTVKLDQAGDGNYNDAPEATESVTATQAPQAIQFTSTPPSNPVYGDTYQPTATGGDSGNPVLLSASGACSYSAGKVTMTSLGVCTVAANQFGDPDYQDAPEQDQRFIVGLRPATLAYTGPSSRSTGSPTATTASVTLTGTVTPAAGGTVDVTQAPVTFLLYKSSPSTPDATCGATVDSSGVATCMTSLATGTWTVVLRMPANSYFAAPDSSSAGLRVYAPCAEQHGAGLLAESLGARALGDVHRDRELAIARPGRSISRTAARRSRGAPAGRSPRGSRVARPVRCRRVPARSPPRTAAMTTTPRAVPLRSPRPSRTTRPHRSPRRATERPTCKGRSSASNFRCLEGAGGPGISACADQDGHGSGSPIDASSTGDRRL